jgi:aldehyde dehydrogenase (NAD+)
MYEYLKPLWLHNAPALSMEDASAGGERSGVDAGEPAMDRTVKQYIGGKQARPDSGYSFAVHASDGALLGEAPLGNRKDLRNAVEAAHKASGWAKASQHNRAQVLYFLGENMARREAEIAAELGRVVGAEPARREVALGIERIFTYAAWADKHDGAVHSPAGRNVTLAMKEPLGVVGVICPVEAPLLGLISTVLPLVAMGNCVVAIPSERYPLISGSIYQLLDTSDVPGGVVNLVAGREAELAKTLAEHDDVSAVWHFGDAAGFELVKRLSVGNLKQVFTHEGRQIDWFDPAQGEGEWYLRHATQVKNIWVPYGE